MQRAVLAALGTATLAWEASPGAVSDLDAASLEANDFTVADQAVARAAACVVADSARPAGGAARSSPTDLRARLPGYALKQSDLVLTGAAESSWQRTGLELRSVAQVLRRARWSRAIGSGRSSTPGSSAACGVP